METQSTYDAYIGLDVHKETIAVAIASPERAGEIRFWGNISNVPDSIRRFFTRAGKNYSTLLVCYEAGPCGYLLYRQLTAMGIQCQIVAPSRIAKSPTDKIKNDHRDAVSLARLLRAESPRVYRRLHFLRGWSYEQDDEVLPGDTGTGGANGIRPPGGI